MQYPCGRGQRAGSGGFTNSKWCLRSVPLRCRDDEFAFCVQVLVLRKLAPSARSIPGVTAATATSLPEPRCVLTQRKA